MILTVRHAMNKTPQVIDAETTVSETAHKMIQSEQDTIIIKDGEKIKGTVNLRNILRYTYAEGFRPKQTPIGEIADCDIILARPNTSLEEALSIMIEFNQDTLPVVDGELIGSINIHEVLKTQFHTKLLQTINVAQIT